MKFCHKFASSQYQLVNDLIHFKLVISNVNNSVELFIFNAILFSLGTNSAI